MAIILLGSFAAISLPRELQPEIEIPYAGVSCVLPGASPIDIEKLITEPLEKEISNLNKIRTLSSQSNFGVSTIFIEFETDADIDESINDLKDAVDRAKNLLPEDATDPMVAKAEANEMSILSFSITGSRPLYEITEIAKELKDELKTIQGVSKVEILGDENKSIFIRIDKEKANIFGIGLSEISSIIKSSNLNFPIGIIQTDNMNYSIRIDNEIKSIEELSNIPLISIQGTTIFLKDIAKVEFDYPQKNSISKYSKNAKTATEAVSLIVYKKTGGNIIKIANESKNLVQELKDKKKIPNDIQVEVSNDNAQFIEKDLGTLINSGLQTALIIIIILFFALGLSEGFLAGLSIPLSFLITLYVMQILELSINSLSLFSLVIALGIMVDTAIVIMDGIHKNMEKGLSAIDSCRESVNAYKWALISGTFTTIFAFFPMLLVDGIIGEFLKTLPIVISSALLASLFVSLTLIPAISSKYLKKRNKKNLLKPFFNFIGTKFEKIIKNNLAQRKRRITTVIVSIVLFMFSMALPFSGLIKMELFPNTDVQYFYIDIEAPKGSTMETTQKTVEKIEEILYEIPEIDNFLSVIGQSSSSMTLGSTGPSQDSNLGNITVNLVDEELREKQSFEIAEELREQFKTFRTAKVTIQELSEGPPSESAITIKVSGESFEEIEKIIAHIKSVLSKIPNTYNVKDNKKAGLSEFVFQLDREKIALHGLNTSQVALLLRNSLQGIEGDEITIEDEDFDLHILFDFPKNENYKTNISISDIENLKIKSPKGYEVAISELGEYVLSSSLSNINHEDQKRVLTITSDISAEGNSVTITNELKEKLKDYEIKPGYEINYGGDLEQINESFNQLYLSMIVGLILIAFTLVLEFNSYKQTFIVLLTLPLGIIGVFPGLKLIGLNFSFPAFLGLVALTGVVVNNAIVLLDSINSNIETEKMPLKEAILDTVNTRVRPIFLTTITTIVGILPLALTNPFWAGLGFTLSFGLAASSITTLIVIPTIYYSLEKKKYE
jgi:HAE1 family hydrophobic/amphiphilic exporter-1